MDETLAASVSLSNIPARNRLDKGRRGLGNDVERPPNAIGKKHCDEAHALLGQNWLNAKGSPAGFNRARLEADLAAIK